MDTKTQLVKVPSLGLELEVLSSDEVVGPAVALGTWEEHETRLFRAHLRPGERVVDLGANIGWFSVLAVLAGAEVHAFEPVPAIADIAERNVERAMKVGNGSATIHRFAAGDRPGTATIALSGTNRGDNRVLDAVGQRPADLADAEELEIRIERVDDHVEGPARILKIDTQGSEWLALRGASKLLERSPDLVLLLEFWPYALRGVQPLELLRFLEEQRFTVGKATAAPYPMTPERILRQAEARDPVRGGLDLYAVRGELPFHVLGAQARLRSVWRSHREE